jgi:hypothetical protein
MSWEILLTNLYRGKMLRVLNAAQFPHLSMSLAGCSSPLSLHAMDIVWHNTFKQRWTKNPFKQQLWNNL